MTRTKEREDEDEALEMGPLPEVGKEPTPLFSPVFRPVSR